MAKKPQDTKIEIARPDIQRMAITIKGVTPLMACRKSELALDTIKAGGPGKKAKGKARKIPEPEDQYLAARYMINPKTHGFPASAIKKAMISAVRLGKVSGNSDLSMVAAKPMFSVYPVGHHKLMKLTFKKVERDDDWAVIPSRHVPIPVYRPVYTEWSCECVIQFDADLISAESVLALLARAGQVGIGALRPECNGNNGMFEIHETRKRRMSA